MRPGSKAKITAIERALKSLEYLKRNTDVNHTITQAGFKSVPEFSEILGDTNTYTEMINNLALGLNSDVTGVILPEDEWQIHFDAFHEKYGTSGDIHEDEELDEGAENVSKKKKKKKKKENRLPIRNLYYQGPFSYSEINSLIEAVLFCDTLSTEEANVLIEKIERNLTTRYYTRAYRHIKKIHRPMMADKNVLSQNLRIIEEAIKDNVKISFFFNGYNSKKKLAPVRDVKDTVSPYYVVASGGKYYLFACKDGYQNMSIWRIDLMTNMEIPGQDDSIGKKGIPSEKMRDVKNLPLRWSDDFQFAHLNMAYDEPVDIKLKIKRMDKYAYRNGAGRVDFTLLCDSFGNTFRYQGTAKEPPFEDIVVVKCSPYAMVNWALEHSDRVEVMEPADVRDEIKQRIKKLFEKYGMEEK